MEKKDIKILLAEDDENLGLLLNEYLVTKGYSPDLFSDGESAYKAFLKNKNYDICILDVMMPKKDGFTLAKDIKTIDASIPIIFLTAKSLKDDIFEGFKIGADDYLTKPFSMEELMLRIGAVLRRLKKDEGEIDEQKIFKIGKFTLNINKRQLTNGQNSPIKLTTKEARLLGLLCNNSNKVLSREIALNVIWQEDSYFNARSMDVYITKLRKMLKDDQSVEIINEHGKGYKLIC